MLGLGALAANPELPVLLLGSAQACMAANNLDLGYVCVAPSRTAPTDWSPLSQRAVTIWPDAGLNGLRAAEAIVAVLPHAIVMPPPRGVDEGWSLAKIDDARDPWDAIRVKAHLIGADPRQQAPEGEEGDPFSEPEYTPPAENHDLDKDVPFLFLGQTYGEFKYLSRRSQQITSLTAQGHAKLNLLTLAPLTWWETAYGSKTGVNWSLAADMMIQTSLSKPIFRGDRIRGRGCWLDEGRVIFHAGNRIIEGAVSHSISDFKSEYIYEKNSPVDHDDTAPLSNIEAAKFLALCEMLPWTLPISARFLAGWCVLAPICGALNWRPHGWLAGASGSGKTTALVDVISPVLGSFKQKFLGATTEAGIRQNVRVDAIPVIMDEAESESVKGQTRMQGVLELIRQASSETGGVIAKGTVTGEATMFNIRSAFLLSSVAVAATSRPDTSRITVMSLERRRDPAAFRRLMDLADQATHNPAWCAGLRARTRAQIPTILANAKHFIAAATARLGDARAGDQIGTLIAGAFSLTSTKLIDSEFARSWVSEQDWTGYESDTVDTDENLAFARLMQAKLRVDGTDGAPWTTTVSEMVAKFYASDRTTDDVSLSTRILRHNGIRIDGDGICVSNTHAALADIYRDTPWVGKWRDQLARMPGAKTGSVVKFGGVANRAVLIPRSVLEQP